MFYTEEKIEAHHRSENLAVNLNESKVYGDIEARCLDLLKACSSPRFRVAYEKGKTMTKHKIAFHSKRGTFLLWLTIILIIVLASGCFRKESSPDGGAEQQPVVQSEPVTLKLQMGNALNAVFQTYLDPVIKQKLPYITLEYMGTKPSLEENMASGNTPDIVMHSGGLHPVMDLKLPYDLNVLIKKYNFDLTKIDQNMLKAAQAYSSSGELYGLPTNRNARVLLYNKDIFDKFAVPYPRDGMSWEDTISLAKRLTRTEGGVDYHGLNPYNYELLKSQMQLHYFDRDGKALLTSPEWQKIASIWKAVYDIPGNYVGGNAGDQFSKGKNTAMLLNNSGWLLRNAPPDLNWDYVIAPTFDNGLIPDTVWNILSISSTSKNKDAAFQVISLFFSDEIQTAFARDAALVPSSSNPEILKQYAANVQGKNVMADVSGKTAIKVVEEYDRLADPIVNAAFNNIATGKQDINTTLREAEEKVNQKVREEKAK